MTVLINVIRYLVPNAECAYTGNPITAAEYDTQVTWFDARPQPSWSDIVAAQSTVEHAQAVANVQADRHSAYVAESDPLFFLWQRGEGTQADWLTAVADIRTRFPMPDA